MQLTISMTLLYVCHCRFKDFDGEMLLEYQQMRRESPETFAACVQHELTAGRLTMVDVLRLNRALRLL